MISELEGCDEFPIDSQVTCKTLSNQHVMYFSGDQDLRERVYRVQRDEPQRPGAGGDEDRTGGGHSQCLGKCQDGRRPYEEPLLTPKGTPTDPTRNSH